LTAANHDEVLAAAQHKSKQQIQELIASMNPRPAAATIIRRLARQPSTIECAPAVTSAPENEGVATTYAGTSRRYANVEGAAAAIAPPPHAPIVTPLAPERYKLQVTLTRETHEKLRRAQALARHAPQMVILPRSSIVR